jgi:hypothetical protein
MQRLARVGTLWQLATLVVLVLLWLGLSGLLVLSHGQPEAFLHNNLGRFSRNDAFQHLNGISLLVWSIHSLLTAIAIAATWFRRTDVLGVLMVGPTFAILIVLLDQNWADPNWFVVVAVCSIGWLVGSVVAAGYWVAKPGKGRHGNRPTGCGIPARAALRCEDQPGAVHEDGHEE